MAQKAEKMLLKIMNEWLCNVQLFPKVWILETSIKVFQMPSVKRNFWLAKFLTSHHVPEVCMDWILDFLDLDSGCFKRDQEWGYLSCSRIRIGLGFCFYWKNVIGSLLDLYFPGLKQESDCLNSVGTGTGLESDSQFVKPDWIRAQKNQSPNTSTIYTCTE